MMSADKRQRADVDRVRQLLVAGRTVQEVADGTGWPHEQVIKVINGTKGWLRDPVKDTVYQPDAPGMIPQLPDGSTPVAASGMRHGGVDELLARAAALDDKTITRELGRVEAAIARLRELVPAAEERAEIQREIATLERELAEAKARLKPSAPRTSARAQTPRPSPGAVRAWAAEHGIQVSPRGKIPASITEQYLKAQGGAA